MYSTVANPSIIRIHIRIRNTPAATLDIFAQAPLHYAYMTGKICLVRVIMATGANSVLLRSVSDLY